MEQWNSLGQWLAMGGYAPYVWPSIGLALAALVLNVLAARRRLDAALHQARRRLAMDANGEQS